MNLKNINNMRLKLYNEVFNADQGFQISNLEFYKMKQSETRKLMTEILGIQENIKNPNDNLYRTKMNKLNESKGFAYKEDDRIIYEEILKKDRTMIEKQTK